MDLEPITILDLPVWLLDQMEINGGARVAVYMPPEYMLEEHDLAAHQPEVVTIMCEKLRWHNDTIKTILVTPNEELALMLRPDWLPGQRQAVNGYKKAIRHLTDQLIKLGRQL